MSIATVESDEKKKEFKLNAIFPLRQHTRIIDHHIEKYYIIYINFYLRIRH